MKWMIASDIHGSAAYCREMLAAFDREQADRLLLLGDLLYHGPRNALPAQYDPPQVIDLLNARRERILCVRGNCDTEVDQMVLSFPIMADYAVLSLDGHTIFATHGHHYNRDAIPPLCPGDVLLYGHTHVPLCEDVDGVLCCNPGSVSIPKGDSTYSYMTLEEGALYWKTLAGEVYQKKAL